MLKHLSLTFIALIFLTACGAEPTLPPLVSPVVIAAPTATRPPGAPAQPLSARLAFVREGQLWLTTINNNVPNETHPLTNLEQGQVTDFKWSPDSARIAYTVINNAPPRIIVLELASGGVTDLGEGLDASWSPDGQQIVLVNMNNVWATSVINPQPRQLTFENGWRWSNPIFTPQGDGVIVAGRSLAQDIENNGNAPFMFERLALDGSGARIAFTPDILGQIPTDVRLAPDGSHFAFTNSWMVNGCATDNYYQVLTTDGLTPLDVRSPSLSALLKPGSEYYLMGYSYAWHPASGALAITSQVRDCSTPEVPLILGAPQLSIVQLDEARTETVVIPGDFYLLSFDPSGHYLAAARIVDNATQMEIYALASGQLLLNLGPGFAPTFAPVSQP